MFTVQFRLMEMIEGNFKVVEVHHENGEIVDYVEDISDCLEDEDFYSLVREVRAIEQATQLGVVKEIDVIRAMCLRDKALDRGDE